MNDIMELVTRSVRIGKEFAKEYGYAAGQMHKVMPEYRHGTVRIIHKTYDDSHVLFDNVRAIVEGDPERVTPPGTYTVLETKTAEPTPFQASRGEKGKVWEVMMSDTPYELLSSVPFIRAAHGHVLIIGLGIGATTLPVLRNKDVRSVTVVEVNKTVIRAVEEPLRWALTKHENAKFRVIYGNGRTFEPSRQYDTIWIDIWPDISLDNRADLKRLKMKYVRSLRPNHRSWIGAWEESRLDRWHLEKMQRPDPLAAVGGDVSAGFKKVNGIKL